ncbi:MAG: AhpC/TSA family protein [Alphaproteobacteria bacterium]|nr:AhpC/TSA family protein [Alphaproteobacteria bacterium]
MAEDDLVARLDEAVGRAAALDAPLGARLSLIADEVRALSTEFAEAVDTLVARLEGTQAGRSAPQVGEVMPPFLLPDETGRLVSLADLLAEGPAVLAFIRGHWCPYCRISGIALAEVEDAIAAEGARLAVITPQTARHSVAQKREAGADYPILTDMDNGYALSINLVFWVSTEMSTLIDTAGWHIPEINSNPTWTLPIPATFVIGQDGIIRARYVDADYRRRMEIADLLAAVRAAR